MTRQDDEIRLRHMLDNAREAIAVTVGRSRSDLDADRLIEIIGEAAARVPADFQSAHDQIPWPQIVAMRNRLVHGYDEVDLDVLWDTITTLGMMICFYYGITAFACVWYFRRQWTDSVRSFFFTLLFPLVGGVILVALFVITLVESLDPDYGSGTEWFGVGSVFVLGVVIIGLGLIIMFWQAMKRPAFFRGETLSLEAPESLRRTRR